MTDEEYKEAMRTADYRGNLAFLGTGISLVLLMVATGIGEQWHPMTIGLLSLIAGVTVTIRERKKVNDAR